MQGLWAAGADVGVRCKREGMVCEAYDWAPCIKLQSDSEIDSAVASVRYLPPKCAERLLDGASFAAGCPPSVGLMLCVCKSKESR